MTAAVVLNLVVAALAGMAVPLGLAWAGRDPAHGASVVLTFITGWNSFLWPLIVASDQNLYTLSVGIALLNQQVATNPSLQMAAASLMVVPVLVVFVVFQRHIVQGFALSGLK